MVDEALAPYECSSSGPAQEGGRGILRNESRLKVTNKEIREATLRHSGEDKANMGN